MSVAIHVAFYWLLFLNYLNFRHKFKYWNFKKLTEPNAPLVAYIASNLTEKLILIISFLFK